MRRRIIRLLPIWLAELLSPYIATTDSVGKNEYWRLYDDEGAGLLIKKRKQFLLIITYLCNGSSD